MNMLKQAIILWQKERTKKGTTLHRRLLLFFVTISVTLILLGLSANEESRKTTRNGLRFAISRIVVSGIFSLKHAIRSGISLSFTV
ncbi:MAG: hypothetical protein IKI93_15655 [Clostridia bacterium]|nr:hypothetical protein [Clostridia bacterium]